MTSISPINGSSRPSTPASGELIDSLIESVVFPHGPLVRAAAICDLLGNVSDAVEWLHDTETALDAPSAEATSLRQLMAAAQDHQRRMGLPGAMERAGIRR